jgi:hypothetical protein
MKKLTTIFLTVLSLQTVSTKGQITLDTALQNANLVYYFNTVQISETETKYYMADTVTNTFSLYNMDFTPFMLNVIVPEPFNNYSPWISVYRAVYITRSLFDCDTSNIEYAYEAATNGNLRFYIMRTDGTQLFSLDSANGPYCFGDCLGGADWVKPIVQTSAGAKLFLQRPGPGNINIYSLCGNLPTQIFDFTNSNQQFVKIFPNPSSNSLSFEIHPPSNMGEEFELVIVDNKGSQVKRQKIKNNLNFTIDVGDFNNGTYIYSLCTKEKAFQNGKFVIAK